MRPAEYYSTSSFTGEWDDGPEEVDEAFLAYRRKLEQEETDRLDESERPYSTDSTEAPRTFDQGQTGASYRINPKRRDSIKVGEIFTDPNVNVSVEGRKCDKFFLIASLIIVGVVMASTAAMITVTKIKISNKIFLNSQLNNELLTSFGKLHKVDDIFVNSRAKVTKNEKAVLFDLSGKSDNFVPALVSSCLKKTGRKSVSLSTEESMIADDTSLCQFAEAFSKRPNPNREQIRLFVLLRNPIINTVVSYLEQNDRYSNQYNPSIVGLTFEEFLGSKYVEKNMLTKSISCKSSSTELTRKDVEYAKGFLSKKCNIKFFSKDYKESVSDIAEKFLKTDETNLMKTNTSDTADSRLTNCVLEKFSLFWEKHSSDIDELTSNYISSIMEANEYDVELYSYALGESSASTVDNEISKEAAHQ